MRPMAFPPSSLLLGPTDLRHVKAERIAKDRVVGIRRNDPRLELCLPMRRRAERDAVQIALHFGPAHLVALCRELEDRIDLDLDGLLLGDLDAVMREAFGL